MYSGKVTTTDQDVAVKGISAIVMPGQATATHLALPDGLEMEAWVRIGETLGRIERSQRWWVGDWLNFGEWQYGETYQDAIAQTGLDYGSLANCKYVGERVEFSRRREKLSWSHHYEVAALEPDEQDEWLARAQAEGWSHKQLRDWMKGPRPLPESTSITDQKPLLRFCPPEMTTAEIVACILRVAFPDARTALDITYGLGAFWDGTAHVDVTAVDGNPARGLHGKVDFRALPYEDDSYDVVLFDPPHLADGGVDSVMAQRYGTYSGDELEAAIRKGCAEAWRVARLGIVVKVTDGVHQSRYIMESDWVRDEVGTDPYDIVYQTRGQAMIDPKWNTQQHAYNNGSMYIVFRW